MKHWNRKQILFFCWTLLENKGVLLSESEDRCRAWSRHPLIRQQCSMAELPAWTGEECLVAAGATGDISTTEGDWPAAVQCRSIRMSSRNRAGLGHRGTLLPGTSGQQQETYPIICFPAQSCKLLWESILAPHRCCWCAIAVWEKLFWGRAVQSTEHLPCPQDQS